LFKTARLNAVGWLAVVGFCVVLAAIFGGAAALAGWSWWLAALLGAITAFATALVWDYHKWADLYTNYGWTDDEDEKVRVCAALNSAGVGAELSSWNDEPPFAVRLKNRDLGRANRVFSEAGIRPIPRR
jgi:hypothetical protein